MVASPNIQSSFGPEVAAYEHTTAQAPQAYVPYNPLYPVHDDKTELPPHPPIKQEPGAKDQKGRILGLSALVFWVVVVIVILLVLGVGIGVGVGVGVSRSGSSASPASPSPKASDPADTEPTGTDTPNDDQPSSTSSAPVTSGTVGLSDNSCTSNTPRTYTASTGEHFTMFCFTDWPSGAATTDGRGEVEDLDRLTLYTFEDCIEACIDYNDDLGDGDTSCEAVTYNSNLTSIIAVGKQGGNCFLKNKRGEDHTGSAESACAAIAR